MTATTTSLPEIETISPTETELKYITQIPYLQVTLRAAATSEISKFLFYLAQKSWDIHQHLILPATLRFLSSTYRQSWNTSILIPLPSHRGDQTADYSRAQRNTHNILSILSTLTKTHIHFPKPGSNRIIQNQRRLAYLWPAVAVLPDRSPHISNRHIPH